MELAGTLSPQVTERLAATLPADDVGEPAVSPGE
jgi:hypothetical protein